MGAEKNFVTLWSNLRSNNKVDIRKIESGEYYTDKHEETLQLSSFVNDKRTGSHMLRFKEKKG